MSRAGRSPWFVVLVAGFLVLSSCERRESRVRVVLITLDTLRYDALDPADGRESTMPELAAWANGGTRFDRFYASTSTTQPSHASMFTGLAPWQDGVTANGQRLRDEFQTVAEALQAAGFSTSAVVASFPLRREFGFAQGFDRFEDDFDTGRVGRGEWFDAAQTVAGETPSHVQPEEPFYCLADTITSRAEAALDEAAGSKQFFWFHYFDAHEPYGDTAAGGETMTSWNVLAKVKDGQDPEPWILRARQLYDRDVRFMDHSLGRLLTRIDREASTIPTHVIIVADHGESFGEDGSLAHGRRLIPSQLHVPCIIRSPRLKAHVRHDVSSSVDIAATLLSLAGVHADLAPAEPVPSRDLTARPPRTSIAAGMRRTWTKPFRDPRLDGTFHILDGHLFFLVDGSGRLFRGNADHCEAADGLDQPGPAVAHDLRELFTGFENDLEKSKVDGVMDPKSERALRALGYAS